jgi:hypothetical protein
MERGAREEGFREVILKHRHHLLSLINRKVISN